MPTSVQMQGAIPKAYRDTVRDRNEADVRLWARPSGGRGRAPDCVAALGNGVTIPEPGPEPGRLRLARNAPATTDPQLSVGKSTRTAPGVLRRAAGPASRPQPPLRHGGRRHGGAVGVLHAVAVVPGASARAGRGTHAVQRAHAVRPGPHPLRQPHPATARWRAACSTACRRRTSTRSSMPSPRTSTRTAPWHPCAAWTAGCSSPWTARSSSARAASTARTARPASAATAPSPTALPSSPASTSTATRRRTRRLRAGPLEDRERDLQRPQAARLPPRTQLRPRQRHPRRRARRPQPARLLAPQRLRTRRDALAERPPAPRHPAPIVRTPANRHRIPGVPRLERPPVPARYRRHRRPAALNSASHSQPDINRTRRTRPEPRTTPKMRTVAAKPNQSSVAYIMCIIGLLNSAVEIFAPYSSDIREEGLIHRHPGDAAVFSSSCEYRALKVIEGRRDSLTLSLSGRRTA